MDYAVQSFLEEKFQTTFLTYLAVKQVFNLISCGVHTVLANNFLILFC